MTTQFFEFAKREARRTAFRHVDRTTPPMDVSALTPQEEAVVAATGIDAVDEVGDAADAEWRVTESTAAAWGTQWAAYLDSVAGIPLIYGDVDAIPTVYGALEGSPGAGDASSSRRNEEGSSSTSTP